MSTPMNESEPCYLWAGEGCWMRRVRALQCPHEFLMGVRCQGAGGHGGPHWAYGPDGSLVRQGDGGLSHTPPGHWKYEHPQAMAALHYAGLTRVEEVTDPAELARLDAGRLRPGEATLGRPLSAEDAERSRRREGGA